MAAHAFSATIILASSGNVPLRYCINLFLKLVAYLHSILITNYVHFKCAIAIANRSMRLEEDSKESKEQPASSSIPTVFSDKRSSNLRDRQYISLDHKAWRSLKWIIM